MPEAVDEVVAPPPAPTDPSKGLIEYGDDEMDYGARENAPTEAEDSPEKREERQARSIALEKAYVHEVYQHIAPHFSQRNYRAWPRVKQFLLGLEPASLVADVGCGSGKYLDIGTDTYRVGCDRCQPLLQSASQRGREVTQCDNLQLPFREESFDAALSVAVVHHFATTERRIKALQELARILRIGGRVLITVWAMEQRHRRFESQDVLVPWHQPTKSSSEEHELTSTTTSDDDLLVYNAYTTHTSDSDGHQHNSHLHTAQRRARFRDAKGRYRGRSLDFPRGPSSPSSSELSSPNETCYSFVRRALKKLSSSTSPYNYGPRPYFYGSCRKPWFTDSTDSNGLPTSPRSAFRGDPRRQESLESESAEDQPIELRHLDGNTPPINSFPSVTRRSRTPEQGTGEEKHRSLGDILGIIPSLLRSRKTVDPGAMVEIHKRISTVSDPREYVVKTMGFKNGIVRSKSTVSCMARFAELKRNAQEEKEDREETAPPPEDTTTTQLAEEEKKPVSPVQIAPKEPPPVSDVVVVPKSTRELEERAKEEYIKKVAEKKTKSKMTMTRRDTERRSSERNIKERSGKEKPKNDHYYQLNEVPEEETEGHMATYYSMPELRNIDDSDNGDVFEPEIPRKEQISDKLDKLWEKEVSTDDTFEFDDEYLPGKNGFVKRSFSVDTGDRKGYNSGYSLVCERQRRFSASAAQVNNAEKSRRRSCGCSETLTRSASRGSNSLKSDASLDSEESIVSVIPRKCSSIQSDTSVDSEESIISVIQRSTSEMETLTRDNLRKEAITRSAQTSPLTICGDRSSVSSDNASDFSAPNSPLTLSNAKNEHFNAYLAQTSPPILQDCQYKYDRDATFLDCCSGGYSPRRLSSNNPSAGGNNNNGYYRHVHAPKALHLNIQNNNKDEVTSYHEVTEIPKLIHLDDLIINNKFAKKEIELNVKNNEKNSPPKNGVDGLQLVNLFIDETDKKSSDAQRIFECSALLDELVERVSSTVLPSFSVDLSDDLVDNENDGSSNREDVATISSDYNERVGEEARRKALRPILQRSLSIRCDEDDSAADSEGTKIEMEPTKGSPTTESNPGDDRENTQSKNAITEITKDLVQLTDVRTHSVEEVEHHEEQLTEELNFELQKPECVSEKVSEKDEAGGDTGELAAEEKSPEALKELPATVYRKRFVARGRTVSEGASGYGEKFSEGGADEGVRGRILSEGRLPAECFEMDISFPHNCLVVADIDPDEICDEDDEMDGKERLSKEEISKCSDNPLKKMDSIDDDSSRETKDESESSGGRLTRTDSLGSSTGKTETSLTRPPIVRNSSTTHEADRPDLSRNTSLSLSTSQESLQGPEETEGGGGSVTLHRYYHVFREGELDHLIETYVENLHIISSYYDHTNWCVIAEKVQVWTI